MSGCMQGQGDAKKKGSRQEGRGKKGLIVLTSRSECKLCVELEVVSFKKVIVFFI